MLVADFYLGDDERNKLCACVYCGNTTGITRDHVIPVAWGGGKRNYERGDTVKCCHECNSTLSDRVILTVEGRASYLMDAYSEKYKRVLKYPEWSESEINELDYNLKNKVSAAMLMRDFCRSRIDHLYQVANYATSHGYDETASTSERLYRALKAINDGESVEYADSVFMINTKELLSSMKYAHVVSAFKKAHGYDRRKSVLSQIHKRILKRNGVIK